MMMNRPKRSPRKKQSPSFVYAATVKRSRKDDVETDSVSGTKLDDKTAAEPAAKIGTKKKLAKSSTSASGMKKVVKKLFLNSKLNKRKRSPKQKTGSVDSNNENDENCSDSTSEPLETLIKCDGNMREGLGHGDAPQTPMVRFHTDRVQTWKKTFQEFYQEQHVKGVVCAPVTNHIECGTEICIKKDFGGVDPTDWIIVRCSGSEVMLQGSGLEEWKRDDFPALMDRVKKSLVVNSEKEVTGCGVQKSSVPSPVKKRSRLSLKSVRGGRLDGSSVPKLAPLFKKCAAQKDGKQSQDAKSGNGKGMKNSESGDTKDTACVAALHNLGNTCFLSSVLQVLRYTPGFVYNISKLAEEVNHCNVKDTDNDLEEEEDLTLTLISNLDQLYTDMHAVEGRVSKGENGYLAVRPYQLMDTIEKLNPMFEGNYQQDAHELLRCLLAYVQDATKVVNKHRKMAKMAAATARIAQPVMPDKMCDVNADDEMATIVAAAVRTVMCSPKPSVADRDSTGGSCNKEMISDTVKCVDVKREHGDGLINGFKDPMSCELNNGRSLERWVNKSFTNHVVAGDVSLTNGWDVTGDDSKQNLAVGSTMKFSENAEIGNEILAMSVTPAGLEKVCKRLPIKCGTSVSPLKGQRSSHLLTSTESLVNGEHGNENFAVDMNDSADLEAQADLLSEKLKLLTQSKSDTNIGNLVHQRNNRWRSNSAGDVRSCGHVAKRRRVRGTNVPRGCQPDIMDMFTRQITNGLTNGVNGDDHDLGAKERLLDKSMNVDEETSTIVSKNGIGESQTKTCPARNCITQNTSWRLKKIVKKQTARKSASGLCRLSLNHHINGNNDGNEYGNRNRCSMIREVDTSTEEEADTPSKKTCDELLKSTALANGKLAVVQLSKSAVSDYFKELVAKQKVVDYVEDLFQGSMALRTRCLECEGSSERKEAYQDIGVPVRNERKDEEEDDKEDEADTPHRWILAALDDVERLQDDNKYVCETCCHLVEAERSMHYMTLPQILTLHLKRFAATSRCLGGVSKINDHVTTPMILPCIQDGCRESCTTDSHRYELYAVITHTGISISSGHYVAYVRMLPPTGKRGGIVDSSTSHQSESESTNCGVAVSNENANYPSGDAIMADPNNNADTNNNVDVVPETTPDTLFSNTVAPSGEQSENPGDKTVVNWYGCDDDVITVLTQDELESILAPSGGGSPYLLFYHKVGLLQGSNIVTTA